MSSYGIKPGYRVRLDNNFFDDTPLKDEWQDEVYRRAREIADRDGLTSVLDLGTGSGYKLLKYFRERETLGMDLPQTVAWLRNTYPDRQWSKPVPCEDYDLVISSDVIEHMLDPDQLLDSIESAHPKVIVLSTPDRSLMTAALQDGPPKNLAHVREWTFQEFADYIGARFEIEEHFISNREQMTQVIVCRPRN